MICSIEGVNQHLVTGCCTYRTITIPQVCKGKVWTLELTTEIGDEWFIKVVDSNQFNPKPVTFEFYTKNEPLRELCLSQKPHDDLVIKEEQNTLTIITNHVDSKHLFNPSIREQALVFRIEGDTHPALQFIVSKKWFI